MAISAGRLSLIICCLYFHYVLTIEPDGAQRFLQEYTSTFETVCPLSRISCSDPLHIGQCSCNDNCSTVGDCCWDATSRNHETNSTSVYPWKCIQYQSYGLYMIASCPLEWQDRSISKLCQGHVATEEDQLRKDPLSLVPVSNMVTGTTYHNYYCAYCHGDMDQLTFWMFSIKEDRVKQWLEGYLTEHLQFHTTLQQWLLTLPTVLAKPIKCNFMVESPQKDRPKGVHVPLRWCQPDSLITTCSSEWKHNYTEHMCHWYTGRVHTKDGSTKYRNVHCAVCNGEQLQHLACDAATSLQGTPRSGIIRKAAPTTEPPAVSTSTSRVGWGAFILLACLITSLVGIVIHVVAFILVPTMRNLPGKMLTSLCLALSGTYITLIVIAFSVSLVSMETAIGFMHYFFLASFFWMNSMAFDVWRAFRLATQKMQATTGPQWKKFFIYSAYSWSCPVVLVVAAIVMEVSTSEEAQGTDSYTLICSHFNCVALMVFLVAPVSILMVVNVVFSVLSARIIVQNVQRNAITKSGSSFRYNLKLCYRLSLFMGVTWILGFVAEYCNLQWLHYVFAILNALQGFLLFLMFTCRKKVYRGIWNRIFPKKENESQDNEQTLMPDVVESTRL